MDPMIGQKPGQTMTMNFIMQISILDELWWIQISRKRMSTKSMIEYIIAHSSIHSLNVLSCTWTMYLKRARSISQHLHNTGQPHWQTSYCKDLLLRGRKTFGPLGLFSFPVPFRRSRSVIFLLPFLGTSQYRALNFTKSNESKSTLPQWLSKSSQKGNSVKNKSNGYLNKANYIIYE